VSKTHKLDIRLSADELAEIERAARALNMSKSTFARLLLTGGAVQKSPPAPIDELTEIRDELAEIRAELDSAARAFRQLVALVKEKLRIPSFREYRSRAIVERIVKRENENDLQYMLRLASRYYVLYGRWPTPEDSVDFGPVSQNFEPQKWPTEPPQ